ncbi:hypothetical protein UMM65_17355 [Aureibaculum sp. 2210JD6-5]|uniref:hypothetical protein n=1 Tax=Aureibaculum sp. 2210JD6-5 TaxID=3103957 RepID=UPI002AACF988|nr:hypothetical protein [Aureibaculum sp. 2210JD6-5]MDY7397016.1 hypothetical protein [Aureibaculum sp. 2210JD6-5]
MKKIILTLALFAITFGFAQRLESKIPANAQAVISINGENLLELISLTDFNNNSLGKEIIKEISRKNTDFNSLADFGFNLESKAFYFYQPTDSISYHNFIVELKDRNSFEQLLDSSMLNKIEKTGNLSSILEHDTSIKWNNNIVQFTFGDDSYSYFSEHEERFMEQAENEEESFYNIQKRISKGWLSNYTNVIFNYTGASILSNKNYLKSIDNKASASAWINSYGELMSGMMGGLGYYMGGFKPNYNSLGFGTMNAHLYFEKDAARITSNMEVNDKWKKAIKKIYRSKIDNSFFKYFNENEIIGYTSIAMDTEAVLDEYPNLVSEMYGSMLPDFKEEMTVSAELFSLIIDEDAIGDLITGNMLFILNDLGEKEVTYTTYEYDDDYNETKVEKTKKEMSPEFTFMIGSENEKLLFKLVKLGVKHKAFEQNSNYYKLNLPNRTPFDLFAVIKDEIVFITSSEKQLQNIISPNPFSALGDHKKTIRKNAAVMYLNVEKLLSKIPSEELRKDEKKMVSFATNNLNNAYYKSGKMKGNNIVSEFVVETAENRENSLKVLLDFIDFMMQ